MNKRNSQVVAAGVLGSKRIVLAVLLGLAAAWGAPARCQVARQQTQSLEEIFHQAQAASSKKDYAQAEKLYRQILDADPTILAARVNLGLAYYWQRKNHEALGEFQRALQASPREFSALLFSGLAHLDLGEYDRAQKSLLAAARVQDMDPLLFWALGSLAMIHGDSNGAVPLLERSLALEPNNPRAVWLVGQAYARLAYRKEGKPLVPVDYAELTNRALAWMEQQQPDSALLHVFRGDVLEARNLTTEALAEYRQAQKIDPHWPDIHLMIGSLLGLLGQHDEAQAELEQQLRDSPDDPRALVEMGAGDCRAGKYAAAVPYLERALQRDAANYEATYRLGQALVSLGKDESAIPYLKRAAELSPEKGEPYYLLNRAYRAMKNPQMAAWALEEFNRRKAASSP
ncbi:MAG: tetratricopeptide repeat protein [Acidobacteriia bacterium]|nr:tetratricopeptide repeat protein [Terriglobia bacterium]